MCEDKDLHLSEHEGKLDNLDDAILGGDNSEESFFKGFKLWAEIGVGVGDALREHTEELRKTRVALQRNTVVDYRVQASGYCSAAGTLLLNLGSPDNGTYWEVKQLVVGGNDVGVVAAGVAGIYISGAATVPGGLLSARDIFATLPKSSFYGTHQFIIQDQENLLVAISGGTNAQQYLAAAQIEIISEAAAQGKATQVV